MWMCNGLSSFAEATRAALSCPGTRAIKSQTRASGAEARRRPGRSRRSSSRRRGSHHLLRDARAVEEAIDEVAEGVARGAVAPEPAYQRVHRRSGSDGRARPPPAARKRRTSCSSLPFTRGRTAVGAACNPATWHGIREGVGQGQGPRAGESLRRRVPECLPGYMYWKPEVGAV